MTSLRVGILFLTISLCVVSFTDGNKKMAENYNEIRGLQKKRPLIPINNDLYGRLARGPHRNFTMIVLFTATAPSRGCQACQVVHAEMLTLADSLYQQQIKDPEPQSLFFGVVDFDAASDVFQLMRLQTAPVLYVFGPKYKRGKEETMDFNRYGLSAEGIAMFVAEKTGTRIKIQYPPDYSKLFLIAGVVTLAALLAYLRPSVYNIFMKSIFWVVVVLVIIFSMLSGQMWNHIRNPPFSQRQQDGSVQYIAYHSQSQLVAETYIVAVLYFCLTVGFVLMGDNVKWFRKSILPRKYTSIVGLAVFTLVFGYTLSIFRAKYGGYPYSFIF